MKKIRIGVLGCANIAHRSVIPAILSLPEKFELVAVASRTLDKATVFAQEFGCEAVAPYESLVERPDIDAVYVPLPTGLHKEWINKALSSGKHVYAEKSIAFSLEDALEMVRNARAHNVSLMEGFMFQYHSQNLKVKEMLTNGAVGDIRHFAGSFGFPPFPDPDNFRYDKEVGGGAIFDACGYPVRAAFFLLGESLKVQGASVYYDTKQGSSLYGSAFLRGENGLGAAVSFGFDNYYQCNYQIWGTKGKLTANRAFTPKADQSTTLTWEHDYKTETIECPADNHFVKAMMEFYAIIHDSDRRERHFSEILHQSEALETIVKLTC